MVMTRTGLSLISPKESSVPKLSSHDALYFFELPHSRPGGGGGVLSYMGYIGTCRGIGYGFAGSRSLNRVSFSPMLAWCPGVILI